MRVDVAPFLLSLREGAALAYWPGESAELGSQRRFEDRPCSQSLCMVEGGVLAREGQAPDLFCLEDSPPHPPFSSGAGLMRKGETHPTRTGF